MMKAKKFLSLLLGLALAFCIGLSACGESNPPDDGGDDPKPVALTAPAITLTGKEITWSAVTNADGYEVYEGTTKVSTQTETKYTITQTAVGSYDYTVYATSTDTAKYSKSSASNKVTYKVEDESKPVALTAPVITLTGKEITWSAVTNADGYEVYEGETKVSTQTTTKYTIEKTEVGTYTYTVYATSTDSKYTKSEASNSVSYVVKGAVAHEQLAEGKKIYVVGDSTVCSFKDEYYLPRYGYGTQLFNYIDLANDNQVVNLALSGRSSLSFIKEANYTTLKNSIGEGDYLIIGFGHNDEKSDDATRFTDPNPDYKTEKTSTGKPSFQYTLYENYVKLAVEKGATAILCTPIVRYSASGEYDGKSVAHVTADGDYVAAIKKLGADTNTAVVDLTTITKEYYKAHNDDAKNFHAYSTYVSATDKTPDGMDATHINKYGAKMIAYWFATNLPDGCPLLKNIKETITAPTYENDYSSAIKSDYVKPDYKGFDPSANADKKASTVGGVDWYKTVMGVLGGASKVADYSFANADNKLTLTTGSGSKFSAGDGDGFGAIFAQIDESKNFTVSVKAKATNDVAASDQTVFGIMLRDDIYINSQVDSLKSNFASASISTKGKTNMHRDDKESLLYDGTLSYAKNTEYEFTLVRKGQNITVTVKNGANEVTTTVMDISYVGVDSSKIYVCLFANRGLSVEFSELSFQFTGDSQGA